MTRKRNSPFFCLLSYFSFLLPCPLFLSTILSSAEGGSSLRSCHAVCSLPSFFFLSVLILSSRSKSIFPSHFQILRTVSRIHRWLSLLFIIRIFWFYANVCVIYPSAMWFANNPGQKIFYRNPANFIHKWLKNTEQMSIILLSSVSDNGWIHTDLLWHAIRRDLSLLRYAERCVS